MLQYTRHKNISLACQRLDYQRSYFSARGGQTTARLGGSAFGRYFWFNRLKQANFDIKSLEERSTQTPARMGKSRSSDGSLTMRSSSRKVRDAHSYE
ncbi:MAG: hypothetical protein KAX39_04880 [candidate division Zixibacteria bacterium]|nr:hypothetical protein [candidate division Zixibacteria bacterium]